MTSAISTADGHHQRQPTQLTQDFQSALLDPELSDIHLRGLPDDNRDENTTERELLLPASKFVLAARSSVFRRMLFGGHFSESHAEVIDLGFRVSVLEVVLQYCYTDKVPLNGASQSDFFDAGKVRDVVSAHEASVYFDLPGLSRAIDETVTKAIQNHPPLACLVVDEVVRCFGMAKEEPSPGGSETSRKAPPEPASVMATNMLRTSWMFLRLYPHESLLLDEQIGVSCLTFQSMRVVLSDRRLAVDEAFLFQCVLRWFQAVSDEGKQMALSDCGMSEARLPSTEDSSSDEAFEDDEDEDEDDEDESDAILDTGDHSWIPGSRSRPKTSKNHKGCREQKPRQNKTRLMQARFLTREYLELWKMETQALVDQVEPSGIVTLKHMLSVYRTQALYRCSCRPPSGLRSIPPVAGSMQSAILVHGAGLSEVNGVYRTNGNNHSLAGVGIRYYKRGPWKDQLHWFCLKFVGSQIITLSILHDQGPATPKATESRGLMANQGNIFYQTKGVSAIDVNDDHYNYNDSIHDRDDLHEMEWSTVQGNDPPPRMRLVYSEYVCDVR